VFELSYYLTTGGESSFESWFDDLDAAAAAKVSVALVRLGQGNSSNVRYYVSNATGRKWRVACE
jgi:hypothetical protein